MEQLGLALENQAILLKVLQILFDDGLYQYRCVSRSWYQTSLFVEVSLCVKQPTELPDYLLRFPNAASLICPHSPTQVDWFCQKEDEGEVTKEGLNILASCKKLRMLKLKYSEKDWKSEFGKCLRNLSQLESLTLLDLDVWTALGVLQVLKHFSRLTSLKCTVQGCRELGIQLAANFPQLRELEMNESSLCTPDNEPVFLSLPQLRSLTIRTQSTVHKKRKMAKILEPVHSSLTSLTLKGKKNQKHSVQHYNDFLNSVLLESLVLKNVRSVSLQKIASIRSLQSLVLKNIEVTLDSNINVLSQLTKLTCFTVQDICIKPSVSLLFESSLTSLIGVWKLRKLHVFNKIDLSSVCPSFSRLEELSLNISSINTRFLTRALRKLTRVKKLSLKCSMYVSSKAFKYLKRLSFLDLYCTTTDVGFIPSIALLPCLTHLTLQSCLNFTDVSLIELSFISRLISLTLRSLPSTTNTGYERLGDGNLIHLQYLSFDFPGLCKEKLWTLKTKLPSLRKLCIFS